jgi:alpha-glucuronidase
MEINMKYSKLWLDCKPIEYDFSGMAELYLNSDAPAAVTAANELKRAIREMSGIVPEIYRVNSAPKNGVYINSGNETDYISKETQAYKIEESNGLITVSSESPCGVLWGVFELIRRIRCGEEISGICESFVPDNPLRMLDHWDNDDGMIERGYSGNSFFFRDGELLVNERTVDYARFAASIGINAVVINNVNVKDRAVELITEKYYGSLQLLSEVFSSYGIRLFLSIDFAAPIDIGGLDSADPCDDEVVRWWRNKAEEIYRELPELGGFLVKADSEGRPGPFTYGRDQADGANMLADALKPYEGIVIWRCFVYNCRQDWRDKKTDRARAGFDYFNELDNKFASNVILQIKNGPMDFQVREPVSPLFGAMRNTNEMLEVQIAQEYTGHQIDVCYLIPWFKEILDFRMRRNADNDTVADYIGGRAYGNRVCGIAAVCNTGDDYNWTGHDLAAANLYGFGRLSFDTSLSAEKIAEEWIRLTYGPEEKILKSVSDILMRSWKTYEKYTAPLGVGWMVTPHTHYGPDIDGYEYSRWGTYHYADRDGIGVDRTLCGTGYVGQYSDELCDMYNDINTCPDELVLFFHHLSYTHVLKSGRTIIQHIYNTHFEGVEDVAEFTEEWMGLKEYIDKDTFERVLERLRKQLENAVEWRDIVNTYFFRKSGIEDELGRNIYR